MDTLNMTADNVKYVPWSIDLPWTRKLLVEAVGYNTYVNQMMPWAHECQPVLRPFRIDHPGLIPVGGRWVFYMNHLPVVSMDDDGMKKTVLPLLRDNSEYGYVGFDGDVLIPTLADKEDKVDPYHPWMSITPNEVMTQRPGLAIAKGKVCIGGLGLGWLAYEVLRKPSITSVTVVEKDPHIAAFFGSRLIRSGKECRIVNDSVYTYLQKNHGDYDTVLMDIWRNYDDAPDDYHFRKLRRYYKGKLWAWGWKER